MLLSIARPAAAATGLGRRAASGIALKYSQAVYKAALSKSPQVLNKVQTELNAISSTIKEVPELNQFVTNPSLSAKDRTAGLAALYARAEGTGAKKEPVSDITKNLFSVLSENGRLAETQGVIEGFNELVAQYKGELTVVVTSANPLPRETLSRLESTLKQSQAAQQAKSLKITNKVNPSILGGIVVDFGDKTIDLSVQSRVTKLNNLLQQAV
ncbi:F1 complex, OSCP/delta subunit of ATPase [Gloeophyllum trabeum ATCC 11539]|uniref:ATP synthase subunit 5, mitochondrial n=1 Tax=Gloeophyllum trabeum (strain ATCC 11539 / FP-39264 / Madison 617) TaxID=670483 RepID=S7QDD6_GLOTA|nr:F1 complex, OSCP/delta subunit of ATPase [Gloeophyllum trabeum ATCC 11539]EPQ57403.1 F1 complex, OSCP/delta subunit of ATPase [Gloeophyllum trabeum ATCC 11539]